MKNGLTFNDKRLINEASILEWDEVEKLIEKAESEQGKRILTNIKQTKHNENNRTKKT